jgi:phenylacetate-CoA ligase
MPLIRYRIGDCAEFESESESLSCACGRSLPRIKGLEGRTDDILHTSDGRAVGRLDPAFKGEFPIHEAQIIQETLERVRVLYVPADGFSAGSGNQLVRAIQERLGSVEVILEKVTQVPREKNGKFRAVICRVPMSQRNAVEVHAN